MIRLLAKILNNINEFIYVAPLLFWDNNLFIAYRKMRQKPVVKKKVKKKTKKTVVKTVAKTKENPVSASLIRRNAEKQMAEREFYSHGFTSTYDHRRRGYVISLGSFSHFLSEEMVSELMSNGRIYAIMDKMKHDHEMDKMSKQLEKNAQESKIVMRHVGYMGSASPANPRPFGLDELT